MTARFAGRLGAKTLALTHFSGAFDATDAVEFAQVTKSQFGKPFFLAEDFMTADIWPEARPPPEKPDQFIVTATSEEEFLAAVVSGNGKKKNGSVRSPRASVLASTAAEERRRQESTTSQ
jgi:hypothetical protein